MQHELANLAEVCIGAGARQSPLQPLDQRRIPVDRRKSGRGNDDRSSRSRLSVDTKIWRARVSFRVSLAMTSASSCVFFASRDWASRSSSCSVADAMSADAGRAGLTPLGSGSCG